MVRSSDRSKFAERRFPRIPKRFNSQVLCAVCILLTLADPCLLHAASNPVPYISAISPTAVAPGGADFTLTVRGTGFINGQSTIFWNGAALPDPTTCTAASPPQLASCSVTVRAAMITSAATASITVVNAGPGGGTSNLVFFSITNPTPSIAFGNATGSPVATGDLPRSVAVGDFNGDGKLDLAVVNYWSNNVTILLGTGDGTFAPTAHSPATGGDPISVAVGDFNRDGKLDLAVANGLDNDVTILLGNGDGTFTHTTQSPLTGAYLYSVAVGDFNSDGKLDLAATTQISIGKVTILLGNGDGTFAATAQSPVTGDTPRSVAAGDFNGDGRLDLAVANQLSNDVTILLGNGDGTFAATAQPAATVADANRVAIGDFNGDGKLDLVVFSYINRKVAILLGNGDGTFSPTTKSPDTGDYPEAMTVQDFNGDGRMDLAVTTQTSVGKVTILLGNGDGTFTASAQSPATGSSPYSVAAGDFNGDGKMDLATANADDDTVSIFLQPPDLTISLSHSGTFSQGQVGATYTLTATNSDSVAISGTVTVTDALPWGLTATAMSGTGWDCSSNSFPVVGSFTATAGCTRSDVLAPGASYPAITLTANVAVNAPASVTNTATVSGGGDGNTTNNTAQDPTTIVTYNVSVPANEDFSTIIVGTTSAAIGAYLTMPGTGTLNIYGVAVDGDFAQTNNCGSSLGPGTSCTISISFTPTAAGTRKGTITITDNAPDSPQTISLSGFGAQPTVTLSATSLSFDGQIVGNVGLPQNFSVTNTGTSPLNISNVVASSSFGDSVGCNSPVPAGSTCSISVFFDPASSGSISGTLTITDDAPGSPHTVALSGTGQDFALASAAGSTASANIVQGLTANYVLAIAPAGGFNQTVAFTCSGAPAKAACTVTPSVVTLNPTSPTNIAVNVSTAASTIGVPLTAPGPHAPAAPPLFIWPAAGILVGTVLAFARRACGRVPLRLAFGTGVLVVAMLGAFSMPGCGGTVMQAPLIHNAGTPAGTYTLSVTGTSSTGSTTLSHSVQLTLTVN